MYDDFDTFSHIIVHGFQRILQQITQYHGDYAFSPNTFTMFILSPVPLCHYYFCAQELPRVFKPTET